MALFDDPVAATIGGDPVLWLGTDFNGEDIMGIVVGPDGHVSAVKISALRAGFRYVNGVWQDVDDTPQPDIDALGQQLAVALGDPPIGLQPEEDATPGVIYDGDGNAYDAESGRAL
jgi:hypothetical protein